METKNPPSLNGGPVFQRFLNLCSPKPSASRHKPNPIVRVPCVLSLFGRRFGDLHTTDAVAFYSRREYRAG